jgi:hypothetical protein
MKRILFFVVASLLFLNSAYADEYAGDLNVGRVHVVNEVCRFGIIGTAQNVCSSYNRHFQFSVTTNQGKLMLSMIIGAKLAGKKIAVWYTPSSVPGTNESTGCGDGTMAVLTQVSLE